MAFTVKERKKRYADKWRYWLFETLGFRCDRCGEDRDLQFDHQDGRNWKLSHFNISDRIRRYVKDYRNGNLRLLCGKCNRMDGARRRLIKNYIK